MMLAHGAVELSRYWWALAAVGLIALLSAGHPGRFFGA